MSSNNWDSRFEEIIASYSDNIDNPIRRLVSEEAYAEMMQMARSTNVAALRKDLAQEKYLVALGNVHSALTIAIFCATLLGIGWSIYAWVQ